MDRCAAKIVLSEFMGNERDLQEMIALSYFLHSHSLPAAVIGQRTSEGFGRRVR